MIDLYTTCIIFTDMEFTNMKTGVSVVSGGRLFWYKQEPNEILWNKFYNILHWLLLKKKNKATFLGISSYIAVKWIIWGVDI